MHSLESIPANLCHYNLKNFAFFCKATESSLAWISLNHWLQLRMKYRSLTYFLLLQEPITWLLLFLAVRKFQLRIIFNLNTQNVLIVLFPMQIRSVELITYSTAVFLTREWSTQVRGWRVTPRAQTSVRQRECLREYLLECVEYFCEEKKLSFCYK